MNHDVTAQLCAAIYVGLSPVIFVRIAKSDRDVKPAIGVLVFSAVDALRHLVVAFPELGAEPAAKAKYSVVFHIRPRRIRICSCVDFDASGIFESKISDFLRRIR